jgi:rSAM/selenodomain-associated transferase 1
VNDAEKPGLIVFLRFPALGKVKSRIARTTGEEKALSIYHQLTSCTLQLVEGSPFQTYLFYDGGLPDLGSRLPNAIYFSQARGDLGERIIDAFQKILSLHSTAIIIGSDCPELSSSHLAEATKQLEKHDIVIGPSNDGGYYLFGCKKIFPFLFEDIKWSSEVVAEQTISKAESLGLSVYELSPLQDIDTESDWVEYLERISAGKN